MTSPLWASVFSSVKGEQYKINLTRLLAGQVKTHEVPGRAWNTVATLCASLLFLSKRERRWDCLTAEVPSG